MLIIFWCNSCSSDVESVATHSFVRMGPAHPHHYFHLRCCQMITLSCFLYKHLAHSRQLYFLVIKSLMIGGYFSPKQYVIFMAGVLVGLLLGCHVESEPFCPSFTKIHWAPTICQYISMETTTIIIITSQRARLFLAPTLGPLWAGGLGAWSHVPSLRSAHHLDQKKWM